MAESLKLLGQQRPASTAVAALYAVPASTQVVVSSIIVCNTTAATATFRIFHSPTGGTAGSVENALFYDAPVAANATVVLQVGLTFRQGNVSIATGTASALTFSMFGQEIS